MAQDDEDGSGTGNVRSNSRYSLPAIEAYTQRIGAEQVSIRKFVIRDEVRDGYHVDQYVIKLDADGEVKITARDRRDVPEDLIPSKAEQQAIRDAVSAATGTNAWPTS